MTPRTNRAEAPTSRQLRIQRAKDAWGGVWSEIRSITPRGLLRILLVVGTLYGLSVILRQSWVSLTPFIAGCVLAYITAPIVDMLDGILPRPFAVLLVIIGEFLLLIGIATFFIPPIIAQITGMIQGLPDPDRLRQIFANLALRFRTLPDPTETFIREGLRDVATNFRDNFADYVRRTLTLVLTSAFNLLRTVGFVLGFVALPTWLFSVLSDQKSAVRAVNRMLPAWMRPDFWAVLTILDRCLRVFVRAMFLQSLFVGILTYLGLVLLERLGWPSGEYHLLMAIAAGVLEFIPTLGPLLSVLLAVLLGLVSAREAALGILVVYIAVRLLVNSLVAARYERKVAPDIHPAILVIAVVALSQFGFFWALLAAPLVAITRDLLRYAYGRLSEPPLPAGLLPGQAPMRRTVLTQTLRNRQPPQQTSDSGTGSAYAEVNR